jgi:asparagine synthetase B (glutamine-hydrolysing)
MASVYWMDEGGATYFCSRIDPLAQTAVRQLRPDWHAWAAILRLGYAVGSRTPFDDVRRLEHSAALERGATGGIATAGRWDWAEEDVLPNDQALERLVEALRTEARALRDREVVLGLSGGGDSRLLLASLASGGAAAGLRALTLAGNWGRDEDERLASRAAAAVAVPHAVLDIELDGYWRDAERVALASDFQQALEWAWIVPLARASENESESILVDGLAGDILVRGKYDHGDPADDTPEFLWQSQQGPRKLRRFLRRRLRDAIDDLARGQLMAVRARVAGHRSAASLTVYQTRTTRGMSAGVATLSEQIPTVAPFTADAVARAAISCPPAAKLGRGLQSEAIAQLAPALTGTPLTSPEPRGPRTLPRRRLSDATLAGFQDLLRESEFRPWFRPELNEALDAPSPKALGEMRPARVINGLALHALWMRRYGDRLVATSPRKLLK